MMSTRTTRSRAPIFGAALVLLASAAACYVTPFKLAFGQGASFHLFGYAGDEYTYAYRIQPLPPGVSAANPVNTVVDSRIISPFYLEDLCRAFLNVTGIHPVTFFWIWRFAFPAVLIGSGAAMMLTALKPRRRLWARSLAFCAAASSVPLLMAGYDAVTRFPPLQGWLFRIPTNIEYPLSMFVALCAIRYVRSQSHINAFALALSLAALSYLRFYTAIPWIIALALLAATMLFQAGARRAAVFFGAAFAVMMAPWLAINVSNQSIDTFQQLVARYFERPPWEISPFTVTYCICGGALAAMAFMLNGYERLLMAACGIAIALISAIAGLLPFAKELKTFDRMGSFYLVVFLAAAGLILGRHANAWRGKAGIRRGHAISTALVASGVLCAGITFVRNLGIDFRTYPASPYPSVSLDLPCVPGYTWANNNTPADALFIVDDGVDWSALKSGPERAEAWKQYTLADDLFSVVARRARVHHIRMYGNAISDEQYRLLKALHYGTVGMPEGMEINFRDYVTAFQSFKPAYIFWKKRAPYPRAMGLHLKDHCKVVYQDDACEIWEIGPDTLERALHR